MKFILTCCLAGMLFFVTGCDAGGKKADEGTDTGAVATKSEKSETPAEETPPAEEPAKENPNEWAISLEPPTMGIMDGESTHELLVGALGDQAKTGEVHLGEGEMAAGTILYPGTPEEVQILWSDEAMTLPSSATFGGQSSKWTFDGEPILGMTVADIKRLNGGPFTFTGCCWDYEGGVIDWEGGKLNETGLGISFTFNGESTNETDLLGDVTVSSENPVLEKYVDDITVISVSLNWYREE